jgi:Cu(I)/Ag(I) efflux system membrane fusion protein
MLKLIPLFLLPLMVLAQSDMKCEAGKCSTGNSTQSKKVPKKEENSTAMKCESGKCSSGKDDISKKLPQKKEKTSKPVIKQLFNVQTVTVKTLTMAKEQVNYGYIVADDAAKVDVLTWYSGFVKILYADTLYKKVKKGDALAKVYSPEVYKAKQDYLNSINYNLKTSMPEMLKSAKIKLELLGIDEKEINAIAKKRKADAYTTVYAPISGWIFEKNINEGASFTSKKRLFQIINLDKVWMEVKLFQSELEVLPTLNDFKVSVKGIKENYAAEKSILYPMLDPKEATATLRLNIDNKNQALKPGMYAKVHASAHKESRLVIPRTAVIRKSGVWYAFLATEFKGEYEPVKVKIKPLDNKHFEVLNGLGENDRVVNNALFMMDSDAQINGVY